MVHRIRLLAGVCAALTALILVSAASAKDGDVLVRGTCTGPSSAKLKLSPEDGRIEVEFEVDQNRVGVRWQVVLRNGNRDHLPRNGCHHRPERLVRKAPRDGRPAGHRRRDGAGDEPERRGLPRPRTFLAPRERRRR